MVQTTARKPDTQVAAENRVGRRDAAALPTEKGSSLGRCCCPRSSTSPCWSGSRFCWPSRFPSAMSPLGIPRLTGTVWRTIEQIFDDPVFWRSLLNTIIFTAGSMLLIVVFGKVLANILVADFRGKWIVRFLCLCRRGPRPWRCRRSLGCGCWTRSSVPSTGCCVRSG